jgi:hypothetical protein
MRKLITLLVFIFITIVAQAQCNIKPVKMGVAVMNGFYRLQKIGEPIYTCNPKPDSSSLMVTILCLSTHQQQVFHVSHNEKLDFHFNGWNYIATRTIWWKKYNGIWYKIGNTDSPTICLYGLNPTACFEKIQ